jgi:copper chaperone CopZ
MTTAQLIAPDISCDHCKHRIEEGLTQLDGVVGAAVSVADRRVTVEYEARRLDLEAVRGRLQELGYPSEPAGATS